MENELGSIRVVILNIDKSYMVHSFYVKQRESFKIVKNSAPPPTLLNNMWLVSAPWDQYNVDYERFDEDFEADMMRARICSYQFVVLEKV